MADGINAPYSGSKRLEHVAVYLSSGNIGVGFDPHLPNSPTYNLSELSEEAQSAFVTFIGEVAMLATGQKVEEVEAELVTCVTKAIDAKAVSMEAVAEIKE